MENVFFIVKEIDTWFTIEESSMNQTCYPVMFLHSVMNNTSVVKV